jgi:deoxycytidylate deaminase
MNDTIPEPEEQKRKVIHLRELMYIYEAFRVSKKSNMHYKHGCIIAKNGKILSTGYNRCVGLNWSHQKEKGKKKGKYSIHAEEDALSKMDPTKLMGASLYVLRWGYDKDEPLLCNSEPCHKCEKKIKRCQKKFGLKNVYYSVDTNIYMNQFL